MYTCILWLQQNQRHLPNVYFWYDQRIVNPNNIYCKITGFQIAFHSRCFSCWQRLVVHRDQDSVVFLCILLCNFITLNTFNC